MIAALIPLWKPIAIGLAVLALLGGTYYRGHSAATKKFEAIEKDRLLLQAKKRAELQAQVDTLAEKLETARGKREVVVRTILKEVPRYVKEPPVACADTGLHAPGFRVLYDAAVAGRVPDPASVASAAPVQATTAAPAIIESITGCNENAAKIDGWHEYANTVKLHNQTLKGTK